MALLPFAGLEQRLRRERPQLPGGCIKSPICFIVRSIRHVRSGKLVCKALFLSPALKILINSGGACCLCSIQ